MIENLILAGMGIFLLVILTVFVRAVLARRSFIGQPSVSLPFFALGKSLAFICVVFLPLRGLNVSIERIYNPAPAIDSIALFIFFTGLSILVISAIQLNRDLIFGLSTSESHSLKTRGLYSVSRHPFYMGFLLIIASSCLLMPNIINILSFITTWIIHHFIMANEEKHLGQQYGDEYKQYAGRVNRYVAFFRSRNNCKTS